MEAVKENYPAFASIPRLKNAVMYVTEKIDGTNALVHVSNQNEVRAGSRTRWLDTTKEGDNFGFAKWVAEHAEELRTLGPGMHYGEWWGQGIQRRYGLEEKRFSLFNPTRYQREGIALPGCVHVVPTLCTHTFDMSKVNECMESLRVNGSVAAPGFMEPEGVVVFHATAKQLYKVTFGGDGHKGEKK